MQLFIIFILQFLAHLLKNRDAHVLDKVNQYFPRSPPRRNNVRIRLEWFIYRLCIYLDITCLGSSHGLVVRVLDSGLWDRGFDTHTGHGSLLKLRQFHLPQFASVYSAANECQHCWEGTCNGLASCPGVSTTALLVLNETKFKHWPSLAFMAYLT